MKKKQKRKHLESTSSTKSVNISRAKSNLQKDALQYTHKTVAPTQGQEAREASSSSEYLSCISSEDKLTGAGISYLPRYNPQLGHSLENNILIHRERDESSESEYLSCTSSFYNLSYTEILKKQKDTMQLSRISQKEEKNTFIPKYFSCASLDKNTQFLNSDEDIPLPGPSKLTQGHSQMPKDLDSEYITSSFFVDETFHNEFWNTQVDAPQPESCAVVPACSQTAEEKSSASEYFSCITSTGQLFPADEDGIHQSHQNASCLGSPEMPLFEDVKQWEIDSPCSHSSFPLHLVNNSKPFMSSVHMKKEKVMKIYYMHVQMKRGVAVLQDTEEGLEPPQKKTRMEEMTFHEKIPTKATLSYVSTKDLLTDSESNLSSRDQEEKEEVSSPAETPALGECSRAKTPEWLVALDSGFRCMGCCRVFPSLEVLQEHVTYGVKEGFSCHAFHVALAWLKTKEDKKKRRGRRRRKTKVKKTFRYQKKETLWHEDNLAQIMTVSQPLREEVEQARLY